MDNVIGVWRRLVARYLGVVEAVGSSPVTPTTLNNLSNRLTACFERLLFFQPLDNLRTIRVR